MSSERLVKVGFGTMILSDGKVLLGKRNDDAEKASSELHGEGTWTMPGGKMNFGETFEEGCFREVLEETGIQINKGKIELISITNNIANDAHFVTLGFLCQEFSGKPKIMEPEEITEWKWFDLDQLPSKVYPPSRQVIKNYLDKMVYQA